MTPDEIASQIMNSYRTLNQKPRGEKELYVTDILYCLRKAFLNYKLRPMLPSHALAIRGTIYHMSISRLDFWKGKNARFEVSLTYPLSEGFTLKGRADVITFDPKAVWEFKFPDSVGNDKVLPLYTAQANLYCAMYIKTKKEDDDGTIEVPLRAQKYYLVEIQFKTRKDEVAVNVYEGEYSESMFRRSIDRAERLIDYILSDELPPPSELEWECKHCPYFPICRKIDLDVKEEVVSNGSDRDLPP